MGNAQQPIKLQNSQILNDLGTKLSHLPLVQRRELAEIINQYRELFLDVPNKTNLIEHDLDVGDSIPIKQHPCVSPMKKRVSTFDMLKGYWQVPLTQRAREISAFVTPSGLYQYKVMPFEIKNAPATFQRMVNKLIQDIDGCEGYIEDVVIYSDNRSHLSDSFK